MRRMKKTLALAFAIIMIFTMTVSAEDKKIDLSMPARINVVLFGLSGENEYDTNRTDSIIIVTVDNENKQLKFTSILRDTKAEIEGHDPQKINAAYRYGGPDLALDTLNRNFGLELEDYITVNFEQFYNIVWLLGGVDIELTEDEAVYMEEIAPGYEYTVGMNHLDGWQALQYCRIRKIDSDVVRSKRQHRVLTELIKNVTNMPAEDFLKFTTDCAGYVESTSLSLDDVIMLTAIPYDEYEIIYNRFPDSDKDLDLWGGIDEHDEWVWTYDMAYASERINDIINQKQPAE